MEARLLLAVACVLVNFAAHAVSVTYSTGGSQLCFGASGCGVTSQTVGGTLRVTYTAASTTVNASPVGSGSLGQITIACVGGGTSCARTSLAGLNLYLQITQTAPSNVVAAMVTGVFGGSTAGSAGDGFVQWAPSSLTTVGLVNYNIPGDGVGLLPPALSDGINGNGVTRIPVTIEFATAPTLTYMPSTTRALVMRPSGPSAAAGAISISASGAAGPGSTTVDACALTPAAGVYNAAVVVPANGAFNRSVTSGAVNVSCQRSTSITTALLACNETAAPGGSTVTRSWQVVCPGLGAQGLDVDGNGRYEAGTDGVLIARYLLGMRGDALIANALAPDAQRITAIAIEEYLAAITQ